MPGSGHGLGDLLWVDGLLWTESGVWVLGFGLLVGTDVGGVFSSTSLTTLIAWMSDFGGRDIVRWSDRGGWGEVGVG